MVKCKDCKLGLLFISLSVLKSKASMNTYRPHCQEMFILSIDMFGWGLSEWKTVFSILCQHRRVWRTDWDITHGHSSLKPVLPWQSNKANTPQSVIPGQDPEDLLGYCIIFVIVLCRQVKFCQICVCVVMSATNPFYSVSKG